MKMKNYYMLIFASSFYIGSISQTEKPEDHKSAVLEKIHWIIERSDIKTVRTQFQKICDQHNFPSLVSDLKDGTYKGATPFDDYEHKHEVVFEMKNGKIVSIDYDEIHRDGHTKQHDDDYCKRML